MEEKRITVQYGEAFTVGDEPVLVTIGGPDRWPYGLLPSPPDMPILQEREEHIEPPFSPNNRKARRAAKSRRQR